MYGVSTPSNAPIIFPASYTLTLFGVIGVFGVLPQRIGVAEQTAQTVAFHQIGVVVSKHPFGQLVCCRRNDIARPPHCRSSARTPDRCRR